MENKKTKIISFITIVALILMVVTATYAYFVAQTGEGSQTDVKITANTVDTLTFETGSAISLTIDQDNFAQGAGNQTGSTFAKAMLTANNKTNSAIEHYYLYLDISENTFTYTQDEDTPEILLTIKDASGNEITSITDLTYKTVSDGKGTSITGFDITNKSGMLTLFNNREITTTSSKTEEWNITITFVNYNINQSGNAGKIFNSKLIIQKEKIIANIASVCSSGENLTSCLTKLGVEGTLSYTNLYHHDGTLENGINDGSYRYAGVSDSVNNYVCFGSDANPCPMNNLYRIIGVIDGKIKLIKYEYADESLLGIDGDSGGLVTPNKNFYKGSLTTIRTYYWNYKAINDTTNTWSTSLLNKINLNTNYLNNIGSTWAEKIVTTTWKVGGNIKSNIYSVVPSVAYQNEITNPDSTNSTDNATEYSAKIGLVYTSDYGFAADPSMWTTILNNYGDKMSWKKLNWMDMGFYDWTITRNAVDSKSAFSINFGSFITSDNVDNFFKNA